MKLLDPPQLPDEVLTAKKVCLGFILTIESSLAKENNPLAGCILPRRFGYKPCIVGVGSARRTCSKGLQTPKILVVHHPSRSFWKNGTLRICQDTPEFAT